MKEIAREFEIITSKSTQFIFTLRTYIVAAEHFDGSQVTDAHITTADQKSLEVTAHHDGVKTMVKKAKAFFYTFFQHTFSPSTFFLSLSDSLEMLLLCRYAIHAEKTAAVSVLPHASVYVVRFMQGSCPFLVPRMPHS